MSFVIGFKCRDGTVLLEDNAVYCENYCENAFWLREKSFMTPRLGVGGIGLSSFISDFYEHLTGRIVNVDWDGLDIHRTVTECLRASMNDFVTKTQRPLKGDEEAEFLYMVDDDLFHVTSHEQYGMMVENYCFIGGGEYGRFWTCLWDKDWSMAQSAVLGMAAVSYYEKVMELKRFGFGPLKPRVLFSVDGEISELEGVRLDKAYDASLSIVNDMRDNLRKRFSEVVL